MKICTSIKPRRSGTVNLKGVSGKEYVFQVDANGDLSAEIEDKDDLANVLAMTDFFPAEDADMDQAQQLLRGLVGGNGQDQGDPDDDPDGDGDGDDDDDDDHDGDDAAQMNALPVEANTPPKPAKPSKRKKDAG